MLFKSRKISLLFCILYTTSKSLYIVHALCIVKLHRIRILPGVNFVHLIVIKHNYILFNINSLLNLTSTIIMCVVFKECFET